MGSASALPVINGSNRSVSCRKITEKGDKSFCRGNFFLCPAENRFLAGAAKKCPKNMPAKFQGCAIFVPGLFPQEGHSTMMDQQSCNKIPDTKSA